MSKPTTLAAALAALETQATALATAQEELGAAQALIDDAGAAQAAAEQQAAEAGAKLTETETKLSAETQRADNAEAEVTRLKAEAKTAEVRAAEICAAAGVDPLETTPGAEGGNEGGLMEQYNAIKDPKAKGEFLLKHAAALYKESNKTK